MISEYSEVLSTKFILLLFYHCLQLVEGSSWWPVAPYLSCPLAPTLWNVCSYATPHMKALTHSLT